MSVRTTTTVIVGAGHAGLAMSRCLTERAVDHVVLERGEVANSWRTERWDSLRLLTPNWQSRLPGYGYDGDDPDGYRTMPEVVAFIDDYAEAISAPVETNTTVTSVSFRRRRIPGRDRPWRLALRHHRARDRRLQHSPCPEGRRSLARRDCDAHADGPIAIPASSPKAAYLVVGASATGIQLAEEIHRSGRPVTLSVGEHVRAPRIYRGRDIQWWMDRAGVLDERYDEVDDIDRARKVPSLQLVGTPGRATLT